MRASSVGEKLAGRRVLVTAGAQGIGEAITRRLIEAKAQVAIHYHSSARRANELVELAQEKGLEAICVCADLTKPQGATNLAQAVEERFGALDCLINNAGSLVDRRSLEAVDEGFWREVWELNVSSAQRVTQAVVGLLARNDCSSIVTLSSLAGRKGGHAGSLAYSTAKGALLTWSRSLAAELGPMGVRVNAVAPGLILGTSFHDTHTTAESAASTVAGLPLGRAGTPDDVARAVVYLASEYDGFITGATLDINGGAYFC